MKAVIDTNVLLVANGQHADASHECVSECVNRLRAMQNSGVTVIDDDFRIINEYHHKTSLNPPKGVGDVFLKWLLRHTGTSRVELVSLREIDQDSFVEFPDTELESRFDAPDRKFVAVSNAHPDRPEIWQSTDCKWLDWWQTLRTYGIQVRFLCPNDVCLFYRNKFPGSPLPELPD